MAYSYNDTSGKMDFVKGTREAIKQYLNGTDGKEDIFFAQDSGTIFTGNIEYGKGVYYPSDTIDSSATNKELGSIVAGKYTPNTIKGKEIGEILDELLFYQAWDISAINTPQTYLNEHGQYYKETLSIKSASNVTSNIKLFNISTFGTTDKIESLVIKFGDIEKFNFQTHADAYNWLKNTNKVSVTFRDIITASKTNKFVEFGEGTDAHYDMVLTNGDNIDLDFNITATLVLAEDKGMWESIIPYTYTIPAPAVNDKTKVPVYTIGCTDVTNNGNNLIGLTYDSLLGATITINASNLDQKIHQGNETLQLETYIPENTELSITKIETLKDTTVVNTYANDTLDTGKTKFGLTENLELNSAKTLTLTDIDTNSFNKVKVYVSVNYTGGEFILPAPAVPYKPLNQNLTATIVLANEAATAASHTGGVPTHPTITKKNTVSKPAGVLYNASSTELFNIINAKITDSVYKFIGKGDELHKTKLTGTLTIKPNSSFSKDVTPTSQKITWTEYTPGTNENVFIGTILGKVTLPGSAAGNETVSTTTGNWIVNLSDYDGLKLSQLLATKGHLYDNAGFENNNISVPTTDTTTTLPEINTVSTNVRGYYTMSYKYTSCTEGGTPDTIQFTSDTGILNSYQVYKDGIYNSSGQKQASGVTISKQIKLVLGNSQNTFTLEGIALKEPILATLDCPNNVKPDVTYSGTYIGGDTLTYDLSFGKTKPTWILDDSKDNSGIMQHYKLILKSAATGSDGANGKPDTGNNTTIYITTKLTKV